MKTINVLMCGGRRTGKTSIMAAIQSNIVDMFPSGDIVLDMKNSGYLINYQQQTRGIFGFNFADQSTFVADQGANGGSHEYSCMVYLQRRQTSMRLKFTDIPGEWFINQENEKDLENKLKESQILIMAIDSPHMMEKQGTYHEVFNRAAIISSKIKKVFQGNIEQRMVLFVPVKCERYRASDIHPTSQMQELLDCVKTSYSDLLSFLTSGGNENIYTIGVTPCFTFGGAEFLRFIPPLDPLGNPILGDDGLPLKDVEWDPNTKLKVMVHLAEYRFLIDDYGDHYYKPENCEQSLLYILLYLIAISQRQLSTFIGKLTASIFQNPNKKMLAECKEILVQKTKKQDSEGAAPEGFAILNDPLGIV